MNILLLNPPGDKIYLRDYYCSKISKANYILHPVDLCVLSGILSERHNVFVIDAIVERLKEKECFDKVVEMKLDVIIFLTGQVSYKQDFSFLQKVKEVCKNVKIIGTGDIFMEADRSIFGKFHFLDAILLDFTTKNILSYLEGEISDNIISGERGNDVATQGCEFCIPLPRHELFKNKMYRSPFMRYSPVVTVLTDYGCPYACDFCIMGNIPYKVRSVENVMKELKYIKDLNIREIYFDDQTFGANKKRTIDLLNNMKGMNFSWSCLSRVDLVTDDFLSLLKKAGCHTIIFGIESGNQRILDLYNKKITKQQIKEAFRLCKKNKINTVGTFLIGLPEEKRDDILETIRFAKEIDCDYASFNIPIARMNTRLRKNVIEDRFIESEDIEADQSGGFGVFGTRYLLPDEVRDLKRKAERDFYFRIKYFVKRISKIRTMCELSVNISNGINLWRKK
ncbi:MAG: radical SAM protein [Candidatus Omnitrophota bacterium]